MKKIFVLISFLVYIFSISSLVHAGTMGFFQTNDHQIVGHCHEQASTDQNPNIDCCELMTSNEYSQINIKIKSVSKLLSFAIFPVNIPTNIFLGKNSLYIADFSLHP